MEERGFDALTTGNGPALLLLSTLLLLLVIIMGGLFFRYKEMQWRASHEIDRSTENDDSASHPVG